METVLAVWSIDRLQIMVSLVASTSRNMAFCGDPTVTNGTTAGGGGTAAARTLTLVRELRHAGVGDAARGRWQLAENKTESSQAQIRHAHAAVKAVRDVDSTQQLTVAKRNVSVAVEEHVAHGTELFGRHGLCGGFEQLVADVGPGGKDA